MSYLIFSPVYAFAYVFFLQCYGLFFKGTLISLRNVSFRSIAFIVAACFGVFAILMLTPDLILRNRLQHGLGGGFIAFLVCFFAAQDSKVRMTRFQFIALSILIVTSLGAANEILEFYLQNYLGLTMATTLNDTWLDLISNTIGIGAG